MLVFDPNKKVNWVFKLLFLLDWADVVMSRVVNHFILHNFRSASHMEYF